MSLLGASNGPEKPTTGHSKDTQASDRESQSRNDPRVPLTQDPSSSASVPGGSATARSEHSSLSSTSSNTFQDYAYNIGGSQILNNPAFNGNMGAGSPSAAPAAVPPPISELDPFASPFEINSMLWGAAHRRNSVPAAFSQPPPSNAGTGNGPRGRSLGQDIGFIQQTIQPPLVDSGGLRRPSYGDFSPPGGIWGNGGGQSLIGSYQNQSQPQQLQNLQLQNQQLQNQLRTQQLQNIQISQTLQQTSPPALSPQALNQTSPTLNTTSPQALNATIQTIQQNQLPSQLAGQIPSQPKRSSQSSQGSQKQKFSPQGRQRHRSSASSTSPLAEPLKLDQTNGNHAAPAKKSPVTVHSVPSAPKSGLPPNAPQTDYIKSFESSAYNKKQDQQLAERFNNLNLNLQDQYTQAYEETNGYFVSPSKDTLDLSRSLAYLNNSQLPNFPGGGLPGVRLVLICFKNQRLDVFYVPVESQQTMTDLKIGDLIIVEADRGRDLGKVVSLDVTLQDARLLKLKQFRDQQAALNQEPGSSDKRPALHFPKPVVRFAYPNEVAQLMLKKTDEEKARNVCQLKVKSHGLTMSIADAEYQWDRRKLTFYYKSSCRIDFRDLVKELFKIYKTRIWMCKQPEPISSQ